MKTKYLIPILAFMLIGISHAQTFPSGSIYYQNITIGSWSGASSQYVQQNITLNESNYTSYINYNGSIANFEFTYANGTVIPSWIESNQSNQTLVWLNITNTTTNVYLDFFNMTTNMLNSTGTNGIGEAPQLSPSYAEYDDGASVFTNYWNFAGTSLPSGWDTLTSGATISVDNGLTIDVTSVAGDAYYNTTITTPSIIDAYITQAGGADSGIFFSETDISSTDLSNSNIYNGYITGFATTGDVQEIWANINGGYNDLVQGSAPFSFPAVITLAWGGTGNLANYYNYGYEITTSNPAFSVGSWLIGLTAGHHFTGTVVYDWFRNRAYPPSGVMPSVSFGSVQSTYTPPTVSVSPTSQTIDIPQSTTLTATVSGGIAPYTYQWYNDTTGTPQAISGATSSTLTVQAVSTGTFEYFVSVTDSNSNTANSTNATIKIVPFPILYYQNITIGSWSGTSSEYVQQMINITESNYNNTLIYNNNQTNFEFTYANGTVIPAWIESNNSGVLTIWLNITNSTTNVYLDISNSTTNTLSSSGTSGIGEAPQLSGAFGSSTFAKYDDGKSVFISYAYATGTVGSSYDNAGEPQVTSLTSPSTTPFIADIFLNPLIDVEDDISYNPSGNLSSSNVQVIGSLRCATCDYLIYIYDGTYIDGNSFVTSTSYGNYIVSTVEYLSTSSWVGYINYNATSNSTVSGYSTTFPGSIYNGGGNNTYAPSAYWIRIRAYPPSGVMPSVSFGSVQNYTPPTVSVSPTSQTIDIPQSTTLTATVSGGIAPYTYQWYNDTTGTPQAISGATSSTLTVQAVSTGTFEYFVSVTDSNSNTANSTNATIVVNSALLANSVTPSSPTIDSGQIITLTANPSGGTTPYSYQWYSGTSNTCSSDTAISGATSNTYTASPTSSTYYCYTVTDSATTPKTNTSATDLVSVNPAFSGVSISPSSATYDVGQTITLTSSVTGGTSPYSYQWYNYTSGTGVAISGATSSTYTATAGSTGTFKYYVVVTDSAYSPETEISATESYIVNTALSAGLPTPSSPTIDSGQSITLTANPSGGTSPYSYQWYSGTSSTCSSDSAISGATSSTYSASPTSNTYYCYKVTDSATTPTSATSGTNLITVNSALTATISPATTNTYTYLTTTLTANPSGGTTPYSYQWYNDSSGTPIAISGATSSTYSVAFSKTGTYVFFANVKDSSQGTPTESVNTSDATINVNLAFTQLLISPLNQTTTYPNPPSFYVNATDMINDTITLNITVNGVSYFDGLIQNNTNITINALNSSFTNGNLGGGTYTVIFNASDALGAYILNQTNFTIAQATPTLQMLFPNNSSTYTTTYNNQNIAENSSVSLPYSANNTNINPTLYLNGIAVQNIALYSQTTPSIFSNTYTQSGTNLAAGTYNYILNTTANQNYTASSISGTVTINKASPVLYLTVPANFTYNGNIGTIDFGVGDINQQVTANLEINYTSPTSNYDNVVSTTTTNSSYGVYSMGVYNTTVYSQATENYTANSTNMIWKINQPQGNTTLLLNGTNGNYTVNDYQTIPINITSTDIGSTNVTLYVNGTEVFSGLANSTYNYTPELICQTINNTQSVCGVLNITAVSSNDNYTNATQTWYLSVLSLYSNITLVQPYNYFGLYNQIYNTSNQIYALLNYTYNVSYMAEYNLTNITVSFGNGNSETLNASNASGYLSPFYNTYKNNTNQNYTIWVNATDIYNNTYDVPINITTQISIPPIITAPLVELVVNGLQVTQNYTWTSPYTTTFIFNASAGNFPIVNTTVNFGDGSAPYIIPPFNGTQQESVAHSYTANGTYNVTVFSTSISGLNSTLNYTIITVNPYISPKITLETSQGFIHNQSYLFNFTQGTFTGSYVNILWGDGTSSEYQFTNGGVSQQFILYHDYAVPQTYELQATVYDTQGLANTGTLVNPTLNVSSFTYPSVVSITPNEPWNGANYLSNDYNITLVEGSYPLENMTINWEDSYLGSSSIQQISLNNYTTGGIIYGIQHTFPVMGSYPVQIIICDVYNDCYTQIMPITLGISGVGNPYLQQQFNNITELQLEVQQINSNPSIQYNRNPAQTIYIIFLVGAIIISLTVVILYKLFRKKAKR